MTARERRNERKRHLIGAGYSAAVATAAARIDDDPTRTAILRELRQSGIADGRPRAYLVAIAANRLGHGQHPATPTGIAAPEARVVEARAKDLADRILDDRARRAARATATAEHA